MRNSCPITPELIDEKVVRLVALQVALLTMLALWQSSAWLFFLLTAEFGLRSLGKGRFSPLVSLATLFSSVAGLAPRPINSGPKQFAAKIGTAMALAIAISVVCGWRSSALALGAILVSCALLEGVLAFCVGCQFYQLWMRLRFSRVQP